MKLMKPGTERDGTLPLNGGCANACACVTVFPLHPRNACVCVCVRGVSSSVGLSTQCEWSQAGYNLIIVSEDQTSYKQMVVVLIFLTFTYMFQVMK